ncbi:MAG: 3-oxoacyl-[acyl-carrier-protein] synthase III C-terminal domain-containing protein [Acidobacteriota bacterium]
MSGTVSSRATILSVATAVPDNIVTAEDTKQILPKAFHLAARRLAGINAVIDNARVEKRHTIFPAEYLIQPRSLEKINCEYKTQAIHFGAIVAERALQEANLEAAEIDLIISVSCTGVMIPAVDAYLINQMGFRSDVKRLPLTELGCAAGAAGLGRATDYIRAYPDANVLVIAIEFPTLTLQRDDLSPANLISCVLFGDGAAAAVLTGRSAPGLQVVDSYSHLIPGSLDAMGFDLRGTGFHIVLSKEVPQLIRDKIGAVTNTFLARHNLSRDDLQFFLLHPGGQKLLSFVEEELGLTSQQTQSSWDVLRDYGNLSSATVLFVAKEFLSGPVPRHGERGLLAAFGPGFVMEMALLEWN